VSPAASAGAPLAGAPAASIDWAAVDWTALAVGFATLGIAAAVAVMRRSLAQADPARVLARERSPARRAALEPLFAKTDRLVTSATIAEQAASLLFAICVLRVFDNGETRAFAVVLKTLALSVPILWFTTDALARALALRAGDSLLRHTLRPFHALQLPVEALTAAFEAVRRGVLRLFGQRDDPESTRRIVAGLREVIDDAEISGHLDESEKEIIGNVMEFRDVDVAAVMTPRTKLAAADVEEGVLAAARLLAETGHSRIPVYEGSLDSIIGVVSARDLVAAFASGRAEDAELRSLLHPAFFTPETKRVRELLSELRRARVEVAIVLDEYGGTAGLVTVGDIVGEIVGEIPDEYTEDTPAPIRHLAGGAAEVDATLHVSEVNEALELELPENRDYETLAGFVLAHLGRFPKRGESFQSGDAEFAIVEATDRRVLKVRVRKLAHSAA
jgi:putative hemolysin